MALDKFDIVPPNTRAHRGKNTKEMATTVAYERYVRKITRSPSKVAVISAGFAGRPDLLSTHAYGTPDFWWVICLANNIIDPYEELTAGKQIKIPIIT